MKVKVIMSFLAGGALALSAVFLVGSSDSRQVHDEKPLVYSMTVSPDIPKEVVFCGKKLSLERLDMYERFDRELSSFTYLHSTTMLLIKRANRFFPVIEPILRANGIPDDFKYLAVIESNLEPKAVSPAKAMGLWQFMPATAKQYGLTITPTVDERRHVAKSTEAACRYLKSAYAKYGDWATVAASYNAGMGRISSELEKQMAGDAFDLWLVEETSRYVFRILAIKQVFENPFKYGFVLKTKNLYKPVQGREVRVTADIPDLAAFAKEQGISYALLKQFNPWLTDRKLLTGGKTFYLQILARDDLYYTQPNRTAHDPRWVID